PRAVLIDPALLGTLPPRQLANGMAEIVKMALTCDRDLFERLEREEAPDLPELITRALRIKIALVERDERDASASQ
ncbi:MAG: 3-dehydroquinate synthase, partial [Oscillospiraceae bacterium]|nr:3-dehydroquinate synthase [Oscillospiraceae bacterium]